MTLCKGTPGALAIDMANTAKDSIFYFLWPLGKVLDQGT
jgi:hypothetical protein